MSKYTQRSGASQHPESMLDFLMNRAVTVSGVFDKDSNHLLVQQQASPDMTVKVAVGYGFLLKSGSAKVYPVYLDAVENVTIGANSSGASRIDAIVIYANLGQTPIADGSNVLSIVAVQGASGGSAPSNADIETAIGSSNPYLRLANVTVGSGVSQILTANISDQRVDATYTTKIAKDDWIPVSGTITRASADDPTYVMTVASQDLTGQIGVGMRIKWTQNSIVRYGIVTVIAFSTNTTITVLTRCDNASADYDMLDSSTYPITAVYFSSKYAPLGFGVERYKWAVKVVGATQTVTTNDANWHNASNFNITAPIGSWLFNRKIELFKNKTSNGSVGLSLTLSTANNSESDSASTQNYAINGATDGTQIYLTMGAFISNYPINVVSKTVLYTNAKCPLANIQVGAGANTDYVELVSNYV